MIGLLTKLRVRGQALARMLPEKRSHLRSLWVMKTSSGHFPHHCLGPHDVGSGAGSWRTLVFHSGCCHSGLCEVSSQRL